MKRLLLAGVGSGALAMSTALAADVPPGRYMPPPRAPAYVPFFSWNGMYVGINAGYGFGHSNWTKPTATATTALGMGRAPTATTALGMTQGAEG